MRRRDDDRIVVSRNSSRIARKFCIRQSRAAKNSLVCANRVRREKIVSSGRPDDVILIDAIATDSDCADQLTVAIQRKASREKW